MKEKDAYFAVSAEKIAEMFQTDLEQGLSMSEVGKRLKEYGHNTLERKKQRSPFLIFIEQFNNPIVWILVVAAILAFFSGEFVEGVAVVIVIVVNTLIGFFMEMQALRSMEKLRSMARSKARVVREGKTIETDSADIVPGDILYVEAGDIIVADARIIVFNSLAVKESALTGESDAVDKNNELLPIETGVADRKNSLFKGTAVSRGNGTAVVIATGEKTELGKIAEMTHHAKKESTPLNKKLNALSRRLIWLTLILTALIFGAGLLRGKDMVTMVKTAVALAVASIPEGLPVIATIALARGMMRLARKKVIVKTLEAVQTLGETEVIFTDKTGTLTENEMYVRAIAFWETTEELTGEEKKGYFKQNAGFEALEIVAVLCNNSTCHPKGKRERSNGDPVEVALLRMAGDLSGNASSIHKLHKRIAEIPFDAELKMMGTLHESGSNYLVCVKGATEEVLNKCSKELVNNKEQKLSDPKTWTKKADELADKGLRVLGFAHRIIKKKPSEKDFINDLTFLGLVGFIDPLRSGIKKSIREFQDAGIRVIMITGDHPGTATAIASEAGLGNENGDLITITGKELIEAEKGGSKQRERILHASAFARVDPSQKLDMVTLFQQKKFVVGMTGDGVNDAPSLKKADIGIAMGIRGTEAAKEAADLILQDDSFASIVTAVKQGRIIFENIRSFVIYLLSCNLSEVLIVAVAAFFNLPFPLLPMQILFLNMITDVFPALAIGMNKGEKQIMQKKPRKSSEPIISRQYWIAIIVYALCLTISVIGVEIYADFFLGLEQGIVNNITFYTLLLAQLWNVFNLPEKGVPFFKNQITQNKFIWYALVLCVGLVILSYVIPQIRQALSLVPLETSLLILVIAASFVPVGLVLLFKRVFKIIQ